MPKKAKALALGLFLALVGIACVALFTGKAQALGGYSDYDPRDGDGWSMSINGVLTIEGNQGWANCIRDGFKPEVRELVIGKDVTKFRLYALPNDIPSPDFFDTFEVVGHDNYGEPIYDYNMFYDLFPLKISVESGNRIFQVVDGLLINAETKELVLSEMGVSDVVIPEGVQTITRKAFINRDLNSVQFSSSLNRIGGYAFSKCENLTSVDLPDSLIQLEYGAFYDCTNLQKISLSDSLIEIEDSAFGRCPFNYIELPDKVTEIGERAFAECEYLERVVLPKGLKRIERGAFQDCERLSEIVLPAGLESIGEAAFGSCDSLKTVILPDSLQTIGDNAYSYCKLSLLRIPEKLAFTFYYRDKGYIVNPYKKTNKSFNLSYVETVILAGSDYDFGYPAITDAIDVYFLGKPPEDVGQILEEKSVEDIYCSEEFEFEWTRSTVASWVRQRLTILSADQIKTLTQTAINTTPEPTNTPKPTLTPEPTETPWPTPMPRPTASPIATTKPEQQTTDPMIFVFAGVLAAVVAGIVVLTIKNRKQKKKSRKKSA